MEFYAYLWLREDGTPYYAGKGHGLRAFHSSGHGVHRPKDRTRILIFPRASEAEAFVTEKELIANWGRKDLGTGCLRNFTDGGDGVSGLRHTEDAKRRMSVGHAGRPSWNKGIPQTPEHIAKLSAVRKGRLAGIPRPAHVLAAMHSPEAVTKSAAARTGLTRSEETKQKLRLVQLGRKASPELRKTLSESHKGLTPWNKGKTGGTWSAARRKAQEEKHHV